MIAVCIPSRGLMHSRTMEDITAALRGQPHYFVMAHGMPQPDAQNYITEKALSYKPDLIWYVDDDMKIPEGLLPELIVAMKDGADVAVADYPCATDQHTLHIRNGVFEAAGMGCVMVRPQVMVTLGPNYFRTNVSYIFDGEKLQPQKLPPNRDPLMQHGGHDVDFWQRVIKLKPINIKIIDTAAGQYYYEGGTRKYGNNTGYPVETWEFAQ